MIGLLLTCTVTLQVVAYHLINYEVDCSLHIVCSVPMRSWTNFYAKMWHEPVLSISLRVCNTRRNQCPQERLQIALSATESDLYLLGVDHLIDNPEFTPVLFVINLECLVRHDCCNPLLETEIRRETWNKYSYMSFYSEFISDILFRVTHSILRTVATRGVSLITPWVCRQGAVLSYPL